jgi:hypothetical protein
VKIYLRDEQASSLHEGPVPRDSWEVENCHPIIS